MIAHRRWDADGVCTETIAGKGYESLAAARAALKSVAARLWAKDSARRNLRSATTSCTLACRAKLTGIHFEARWLAWRSAVERCARPPTAAELAAAARALHPLRSAGGALVGYKWGDPAVHPAADEIVVVGSF